MAGLLSFHSGQRPEQEVLLLSREFLSFSFRMLVKDPDAAMMDRTSSGQQERASIGTGRRSI